MLRGQVRNRDSGFREKTCERSLFGLRDRQMYRRCRDERSSRFGEEICEESRLSSSCCSCLRRSLRTGLTEQAGEEAGEESLTLNQTTDHDGKFGDLCRDLCRRPGGKRAGGVNPFCYHICV